MVDPVANKVVPGCHRSGVAIAVGDCIGGRHLVEAVARLGTSTGEVSSLTTIGAPPILRVLHWPLIGLLPLHVMPSQGSNLGGVGALYELVLWGSGSFALQPGVSAGTKLWATAGEQAG
jgi:hypothetical protein